MSSPNGHWLTASDADLWQHLVQRGLTPEMATRHVLLRRQATVGNLPQNIKQELDPGALASFGLGAADMASFGLGDQLARAIEPEAAMTQQLAGELHPTAHMIGEAAGLLSPLGLERGLALAGAKIAPTAIGAAVQGIKSLAGRAAAKTALNAAIGAGYAGAQAAGRTEGGLEPRLTAAKQVAIPGAVAGTIAPWIAGSIGAAGSRLLGGVAKRVAGPGLLSEAAAETAAPVTGVTAQEAAVAKALNIPVSQVQGRVGDAALAARAATRPLVPSVAPAPDVLATPTYARRAAAAAADPRIPANSYKELQQLLRSGVPKEQIKVNYWTRGGAAEQSVPPVPVAAAQPVGPILAFVRGQPYEALSQALANQNTPAQVRTVILQELKRRGIVGSGLLDPMGAPVGGLLAP